MNLLNFILIALLKKMHVADFNQYYIFNDFIKILKIIAVSKIPPKNSQKLKQFNKIIIELETLFNTSDLTVEKYETYAKNITELMESVK